jgi:hypothetical protein
VLYGRTEAVRRSAPVRGTEIGNSAKMVLDSRRTVLSRIVSAEVREEQRIVQKDIVVGVMSWFKTDWPCRCGVYVSGIWGSCTQAPDLLKPLEGSLQVPECRSFTTRHLMDLSVVYGSSERWNTRVDRSSCARILGLKGLIVARLLLPAMTRS